MRNNSPRVLILQAFKEGEVLTKHELFNKIKRTSVDELKLLAAVGLVEKIWEPKKPNRYRITQLGMDRRTGYNR